MTAALVDTDAAALETTPISVWGLGKLGLPVAAVFADQFGSVTGVDVDPSVVETVSRGTVR
ncbi:MAG: hypothetical protein U5K37_00785 [Natrialbaceae archaeon]|nr:hypothetical protein [Natrialbaceae archaeon]